MKYQWIRERNFILLIPFCLVLIFGLCVDILRWNEYPTDLRVFMMIVHLLNLAVIGYLLYFALRPAAYARILEDGIHVISKEQGEIMVIPWEKAKECRWIPGEGSAIQYIMLIFRWKGTFRGKPLSTYRGSPTAYSWHVKPYLLDNLMEKLVRGEMTPEEFESQPMLLLGTDEKKFEQCRAMWRAKIKPQPEGDAENDRDKE